MAFSQFDLASMVRCKATNEEGFRCRLVPNHRGGHEWDRCEWTDERGVRCILPHLHPTRHVLFWYDEAVPQGTRRTLEFPGTQRTSAALANRAVRLATARGWVEVERSYAPSLGWRIPPIAAFLQLFTDPQGAMRVTFEHRRGVDERE